MVEYFGLLSGLEALGTGAKGSLGTGKTAGPTGRGASSFLAVDGPGSADVEVEAEDVEVGSCGGVERYLSDTRAVGRIIRPADRAKCLGTRDMVG